MEPRKLSSRRIRRGKCAVIGTAFTLSSSVLHGNFGLAQELRSSASPPPPPISRAESTTLRASIGNDPIVLASEPRFAGAISELWFRSKQYINSADHGRLISTAVSFDGWGECLNPTEGGFVQDGGKRTSTSVLLGARVSENVWESETRMAYWMPPGAPHRVNPFDNQVYRTPQPCTTDPARASVRTARNFSLVSNVVLHKRIEMGALGLANVLRFDMTFSVSEPHEKAIFEALTAYLEPEFDRFYLFDRLTRALKAVSQTGSGPVPVAIATADGRSALAIADDGPPYPQFARFRWLDTSKHNCVYPTGKIAAGDHTFTCLLVIGTLEEVAASLSAIETMRSARRQTAQYTPLPAAPVFAVNRWRDPAGGAWSYSIEGEKPEPGTVPDGIAFHAFSAPAADRIAIYACHLGFTDDTFLSQQDDCEGASVDAPGKLLGYILRSGNAADSKSELLFRCLNRGKQMHLSTTDRRQCAAADASVEGIQGAAPRH